MFETERQKVENLREDAEYYSNLQFNTLARKCREAADAIETLISLLEAAAKSSKGEEASESETKAEPAS